MKITVLALFIGLSSVVKGQEKYEKLRDDLKKDTLHVKPWSINSIFGINGSQTAFVNWAAGGRNNVSMLGFIDFSAVYHKNHIKWTNDIKLALGGLIYTDSTGKKQGLQKTDDKIDVSTSLGYEFKKNWFFTGIGGFRSQFLDGYNYPNDSIRISTFLAPAYINLSLGIEYAPKDYFNVYLSPLAYKLTIVKDQVLANEGAFGVKKAERDTLGNVLTPGKYFRHEIGAYFRMRFQKEIMKNIEMKTRLELFSNYLTNPQNIDVNFENIFAFKINNWFSASLQWNLIYDDDINIRDAKGGVGPRVQFKSVLGLGISYTLTNKK